jgi:hypothetical protein
MHDDSIKTTCRCEAIKIIIVAKQKCLIIMKLEESSGGVASAGRNSKHGNQQA